MLVLVACHEHSEESVLPGLLLSVVVLPVLPWLLLLPVVLHYNPWGLPKVPIVAEGYGQTLVLLLDVVVLPALPWLLLLLPNWLPIVGEGNGQPLPEVVVVVVVELPALPNVVGPPVVPVVPAAEWAVDGSEVVLRVDVRDEAHEDRADEQPARLQSYGTELVFGLSCTTCHPVTPS